MSAAAAPAPDTVSRRISAPVRTGRAATGEVVLPVALARLIAFAALAAWGVLHWMSMLEPAEPSRGWTVLLIGLLAAAAMLGAGRFSGWRRTLVAVAAIVPLVALMLMAGRVPDELLLPSGWSELAGGISRGISDLPGVRVPYRGLDEWVRTVIPLGGSVLVLLAALLAFWPRRSRLGFPGAALLVLIVLYVVPVVALDFTSEFLRGAVFTLLMIAFLRLEKLRGPDAAAAGALAAVATIVALAAAPVLNRDQPWWDYESWALETSTSKSTSFTWDHTYGQLNWPRDGRELLRVKAKTPAYWKAENLDDFDGSIWRRSQRRRAGAGVLRRRRAGARSPRRPCGSRSATCARTSSSPRATRSTSRSRSSRACPRWTGSISPRARCGAATPTPPACTPRARSRPSAGGRAWSSTIRCRPTPASASPRPGCRARVP